jgi:poly(3-hydroxybutyrate) depolymerase
MRLAARVVALLVAAAAAHAEPLPTARVDPSMTTLSGLSSGGYMAVQLHVAYSSVFRRGVGVVAAGPWFCAEGQLRHATGRCLTHEGGTPVDALVATARRLEARGAIDPLSNLRGSKVYLFSGARDTAVVPPLPADLARWYTAFGPELKRRSDVPAEHGMVTDDHGNPCDQRGGPYIQNCGFDLAGEMLAHLYGPLAPRNDGAPRGRWRMVDQFEFIAPGRGMAREGLLYVPPGCDVGEAGGCRLHVVLHGCGQNAGDVGEAYTHRTGYPRWADANRIVLLFPQTGAEALHSCWDWWGYTGADYATRTGTQVAAIKGMVDRLAGVAADCRRAFNAVHLTAGRAVAGWWGALRARGSGIALGWPWQRTALAQTTPGHWVRGNC